MIPQIKWLQCQHDMTRILHKKRDEAGFVTISILFLFMLLIMVWSGIFMGCLQMQQIIKEEQCFVTLQYEAEGGVWWVQSFLNTTLPDAEKKTSSPIKEHQFKFNKDMLHIRIMEETPYKKAIVQACTENDRYMVSLVAYYEFDTIARKWKLYKIRAQ